MIFLVNFMAEQLSNSNQLQPVLYHVYLQQKDVFLLNDIAQFFDCPCCESAMYCFLTTVT